MGETRREGRRKVAGSTRISCQEIFFCLLFTFWAKQNSAPDSRAPPQTLRLLLLLQRWLCSKSSHPVAQGQDSPHPVYSLGQVVEDEEEKKAGGIINMGTTDTACLWDPKQKNQPHQGKGNFLLLSWSSSRNLLLRMLNCNLEEFSSSWCCCSGCPKGTRTGSRCVTMSCEGATLDSWDFFRVWGLSAGGKLPGTRSWQHLRGCGYWARETLVHDKPPKNTFHRPPDTHTRRGLSGAADDPGERFLGPVSKYRRQSITQREKLIRIWIWSDT